MRGYFEREFVPDIYLNGTIASINFALLSSLGITKYIIDADNTLAYRHSYLVEPTICQKITEAKEAGYIKDLAIVSNTIINNHERAGRIWRLCGQLGTENYFCAGFWDRKPKPIGFQTMMEAMKAEPDEVAVIGDQMMTDIRGGNNLELFTILVRPLGKDYWGTKLNRSAEWLITRYLGLKPGPFPVI